MSVFLNKSFFPFSDITFGNEESVRFFENEEQEESQRENDDNEGEANPCDLSVAYNEYIQRNKTSKTFLVQRDRHVFWNIVFRQKFDLSKEELRVRFAGESASDHGGPQREFLTLSMQWFADNVSLLFGAKDSCGFKSNVEALLEGKYKKLGELTALSILLQSRGPECLHPAIVRCLFDKEQPLKFETFDDGKALIDFLSIDNGNYDCLFDNNINPAGKTKDELKRLYFIASIIHSNYSAIEQFSSGIHAVSKLILNSKNYEDLRYMFEHRKDRDYDFEQIMSLLNYKQNETLEQTGSNAEMNIRECIAEFELFLINIGQKTILVDNIPLTFEDLILFCTGSDRIPTYGFEKKIDIEFVDCELPRASTCGLILSLTNVPNKIAESIITAIKFGGGFGRV